MGRWLLREVASVQTGYSFRAALDVRPDAAVAAIQMRDLGSDLQVNLASLDRVDVAPNASHWVRSGDIVVRSRGDSTASAIVAEDPGWAVVAAPLLRVRVSSNRLLPEYLNWYLNQPKTRAALARSAEGSNVKMISLPSLEALEVEVPPLERQTALVELASLLARSRELEQHLNSRREHYLTAVMMQYAEGGLR